MTGRIEAAVGFSDAGQIVVGRSREAARPEAALGAVYLAIGQPKRMAELVPRPARTPPRHPRLHPGMAGCRPCSGRFGWEAMDSADGLIEAAEATGNPMFLSWALFAYGAAFRDANPVGALNALGRGLVIAQDNGHRTNAQSWRAVWPNLRPHTATPCPHSITSLWRSASTTMRATPRRSRPAGHLRRSFRPARTLRTGGHHRRFRAQSHRRGGGPRNHHRDHPPARGPRRGDLRIARPQG